MNIHRTPIKDFRACHIGAQHTDLSKRLYFIFSSRNFREIPILKGKTPALTGAFCTKMNLSFNCIILQTFQVASSAISELLQDEKKIKQTSRVCVVAVFFQCINLEFQEAL